MPQRHATMPKSLDSSEQKEELVQSFAGADVEISPLRAAGIGGSVATGTFWVLLQSLGNKFVLLLGQLALAKLLAPDDFGQIGMAYTVTTFVSLLINPGIDVILVRRGKRFDLWSTPAFYFSLASSLLGCLVIFAMAPIVAWFYETPQVKNLLAVLAIAVPIGSLLLVPTAKLRSHMRFKTLAAINLLQVVLQTCLTISFAAFGFGAYSFVMPMPVVYLVVAAVLWYTARPLVRLQHPFRHWRHLIGDSSYIFGTSVLITLVGQGDFIILGAMYGDAVLGPYFFAFGIAMQAIRLTAGSLQQVLMAGLSRMAAFSAQQTQAALRASRAIALFGVPLCFIQAVAVGPFLQALYGDKWQAAIPLAQLISVGMGFNVLSWPAYSLLQSRGQFRFLFGWSSTFAPIFIAAVLLGALAGKALGVAIAVCAYYTFLSPLLAMQVFRSSGVSSREILNLNIRPLLIGTLAASASLVSIYLSSAVGANFAVQFVLATGAGLIAMGLSARLIMSSAWSEITIRLHHVINSTLMLKG